jgi:hypothetical protein
LKILPIEMLDRLLESLAGQGETGLIRDFLGLEAERDQERGREMRM